MSQAPDRSPASDDATAAPSPSQDSRRRMLLKGLGKGSVVLAATVPIKALAVTSITADKHLCTVSGVQSGVRSNPGSLPTCSGKSFQYYQPAGRWPLSGGQESVYNGTNTYLRSGATFAGVFGGGSASTMATLFAGGLTNATASDEAHWIVALLNAGSTNGINYPYTALEIVALYSNALKRAAALAFFKTYMELGG
ncbi:hypothetical protein [Ideonella sp. A 288]|uniref:hypothetical protein n=1 Tax=Ideonella sp. A 288 TaxID=1962181 RepID=UPI000B4B73CC|nr:hypothetical protein [Ideonella sp. A 288]